MRPTFASDRADPTAAPLLGGGMARLWPAVQARAGAILAMLVAATVIYLVVKVFPHLGAGPQVFSGFPALNRAILLVHVIFALPPLILGLFAFNPALRRGRLGLHRWIGSVYCVSIWIAAATGIVLASGNWAGGWAAAGFGILGVLWYATTLEAYRTARRRDIRSHRVWMVRSFALTLAVVTVRPLLLVEPPFGFSDAMWGSVIAWACWVPNLWLAETYLRVTTPSGAWALGHGRPRAAAGVSSPALSESSP